MKEAWKFILSRSQFLCGFFGHKQELAADGSWPCPCRWAKGDAGLHLVPLQRTASDAPARVG